MKNARIAAAIKNALDCVRPALDYLTVQSRRVLQTLKATALTEHSDAECSGHISCQASIVPSVQSHDSVLVPTRDWQPNIKGFASEAPGRAPARYARMWC